MAAHVGAVALAAAPAERHHPSMTTPILLAAACLAANLNCATDMPRGRAEPKAAEAVPCPQVGPGYIRVPGSSTCIKVGGYLRTEGAVTLGR